MQMQTLGAGRASALSTRGGSAAARRRRDTWRQHGTRARHASTYEQTVPNGHFQTPARGPGLLKSMCPAAEHVEEVLRLERTAAHHARQSPAPERAPGRRRTSTRFELPADSG